MSAVPRIRIAGVDDVTIDDIRAEQAAARRKAPPARMPTHLPGRGPMVLRPIPWGKRDSKLGKLVCTHAADVNPPTVVPYNPTTDARIRSDLRRLRVEHY